MGRTSEEPIELEATYRGILKAAIERSGGQEVVAELAGVNQSTISRTLRPDGRATYTTLLKLSRVLEGVPSPVVAVRDATHEQWCRIGARLAESKPGAFSALMAIAIDALGADAMKRLEAAFHQPMPSTRKRSIRSE